MITDVNAIVFMAILSLVTLAWISLLAKVLRGNEILAFAARRDIPWGLISVVLSFVLLIGSQIVAGLAFDVAPDAEPTVAQTEGLLTWTAVAILAATTISIGLIHLLVHAGREDFGISLEHVPHDLFIGGYAFLILAPITFAIQYLFVYVFRIESHHPLIEMLKEDTTGKLFGVVTLLAVIVAPISEEYFFRVLLQGWLERSLLSRKNRDGEVDRLPQSNVPNSGQDNAEGSTEGTPESAQNPYASPSLKDATDRNSGASVLPYAPGLPIGISAAVFALMHWSHGPDPAALFVLAIGLGYLYQRTHRWLPCVVTHACLNGTTMLLLWFGLDELPS
ncbi:MAG: CPBP family intramembrane metalloprotease [Planctomycetia bacterium]|nr:CPBP family intramembrane metalloprotease [Planctomycetia bacterium]